jgi:hypothetical protein
MTRQKSIEEKFSFLESFLNVSLSKDGVNASIWCPFCKHPNKNKLKLAIHLEKNLYHCWICSKKGSNVPYVISRLNRSKSETSSHYFQRSSRKKSLFEDEEDIEEIEIVQTPKGFKLLANAFSATDPDVRDVFKYALKRGVTKHKIWFLRLGYSLDQDFRRSLILPSLDCNGEINFYTSRKIDKPGNSPFKYKNADVKKKNIIFNEINIDWNRPLTIVEGPLDLLKTNDNATCLLGSSLTPDMKLFSKIVENKTNINLALDSDVYYKSIQIADVLYSYNINVNILDTRSADDVGDMSHAQFMEALNEANLYKKEDTLLSKIAML